jgi:hypothetical protein
MDYKSDSAKTPGWTWSAAHLDAWLAPRISQFTAASIPDLREEFPKANEWLTVFFEGNTFRKQLPDPSKQKGINFIQRTQTAFRAFHEGRALTLKYLDGIDTRNPLPRVHLYFEALGMWEWAFQNFSVCVAIANTLPNIKCFEKYSRSADERAYGIAEDVRHVDARISNGKLIGNGTVPLWLVNEGFHSVHYTLSYEEFAGVIRDTLKVAEDMATVHRIFRENARE